MSDIQEQPAEDNRPYLLADLTPEAEEPSLVLYPPKGYKGAVLSFKELVGLMKSHSIIPMMVDNELMFINWDEGRLFFGIQLDQFLIDAYDLFPVN